MTLNRFLPAAITKKVLLDMGINLVDVAGKLANLNAQEIGRDSDRIKQWKKMNVPPVFDEKELNNIIQDSLTRLGAMQLSDGGWGWFSGYGEWSSPHTTALVVHGLLICRKNDVKFDENMLNRGIQWLKNYQAQELAKNKNAPSKTEPYKGHADNLDALVYMVLSENKFFEKEMKAFLIRDKKDLSVYGLSLIGLAFHEEGDQENRDKIVTNMKQYLVEDNENQTAYLRLPQDYFWWFWYGSETETQAFFLKLIVVAEPKGDLAPKLVKYLLNNRKHSTYWDSTRDTAYCIEAFADFLRGSGEDAPDMTVEVKYDGKTVKTAKIDKSNLFTFDDKVVMKGSEVATGNHNVEIVKKGKGPLYFNSYLSYFTLEDFITKAGLEIKVERKYYRLKETTKKVQVQGKIGNALLQNQEKYEREEISDKTVLKSGDMVEVELIIESKNDYEYIIFEDMKPAGFEASEVRSGYNGNALNAYVEFHTEKVCFFVRTLARGKHSVAYRVRAEIPGSFSALPTKASAMYAPELRGNSDEFKTTIKDK